MPTPLKVLILEDSPNDILLLLRELRRNSFEVDHVAVSNAGDMRKALRDRKWDIILSDYSMGGFDALAALQTVYGINLKKDKASLKQFLQQSIYTKEWMVKGIYDSRAKDYTNPFRKMVYENRNEMDKVTGSLEKNSFIRQEQENLVAFKKTVQRIIKVFKL